MMNPCCRFATAARVSSVVRLLSDCRGQLTLASIPGPGLSFSQADQGCRSRCTPSGGRVGAHLLSESTHTALADCGLGRPRGHHRGAARTGELEFRLPPQYLEDGLHRGPDPGAQRERVGRKAWSDPARVLLPRARRARCSGTGRWRKRHEEAAGRCSGHEGERKREKGRRRCQETERPSNRGAPTNQVRRDQPDQRVRRRALELRATPVGESAQEPDRD